MRNKISDLLARIDKLCVIFAARASDIEEQKRRDTLLRYATVLPLRSALNSFQRVPEHRNTTAAVVEVLSGAEIPQLCS